MKGQPVIHHHPVYQVTVAYLQQGDAIEYAFPSMESLDVGGNAPENVAIN
jgi:hypothetical protein